MQVLIIDTTTKVLCLGLYSKGSYISSHTASDNQATIILPEIDRLLQRKKLALKDLEYIATGLGPGSFSGLKISSAIVQSIMVAHELPVIPFSSLLALALTHEDTAAPGCVTVMTYANRDNFYVGQYDQEVRWEKLLPQIGAIPYLTVSTWGDERVKQIYPQCKLLYRPLALDRLLPYISRCITQGKVSSILPNPYYL